MSASTEVLHLRVDDCDAHPAVTPIYQCSAFTADSPFFYSRKNNPNVVEFEQVVAKLENSRHAVAYATGMSAIYMVLELLNPKATLVINKDIYGCSYKLFQRTAARLNLTLLILDLSTDAGIRQIPDDTDMVFFETPTNPFLKTIDIARVSRHVKALNGEALVVVDNTWATPAFQHPLEFGADISLHSATKYFSGHSDVMGGVALVDDDSLHTRLLDSRFYAGSILTPYSAWLLRRSMNTFRLRMNQHSATTIEMADFVRRLPYVKQVYYPMLGTAQLTGYGGIIFFDLRDDLVEAYAQFARSLRWFDTGTGMACVTSMIAQPFSGSHASMTDDEKARMGIGKGLIRLCFGLEDPQDLKDDLLAAFTQITGKRDEEQRSATV
jgi:cystathionine gamma-lyase / homocysteine desulfhydrase